MKTIRWGVIGSGIIADKWLAGSMQVPDMQVVAIASRSAERAKPLAEKYGIVTVCASIEALLARADIDAVYIATPHTSHYEWTMLSLAHGKHVLCEKPMGINEQEESAMVAYAKEKQCFLMEATWMRFFPMMQALREEIASGVIGELRCIRASFTFQKKGAGKEHRLFNPELAGGALLDVGIYCLHFCEALLGATPLQVHSLANINTDENHYGVDEQSVIIARYPKHVLATLTCSVATRMGDDAVLYGTKGRIEVPTFWQPTQYSRVVDEARVTVDMPVENTNPAFADLGYQYEIAHMNDCLRKHQLQSPVMTHDSSLAIIRLCDTMRKEWGLVYPMEKNDGRP